MSLNGVNARRMGLVEVYISLLAWQHCKEYTTEGSCKCVNLVKLLSISRRLSLSSLDMGDSGSCLDQPYFPSRNGVPHLEFWVILSVSMALTLGTLAKFGHTFAIRIPSPKIFPLELEELDELLPLLLLLLFLWVLEWLLPWILVLLLGLDNGKALRGMLIIFPQYLLLTSII